MLRFYTFERERRVSECLETHIASGNVVVESKAAAPRVKGELEARLRTYARKPIGVIVRTGFVRITGGSEARPRVG